MPDPKSEPAAADGREYRCIMGVDPGLTGAVAFYFPGADVVSVRDMPVAAGSVDGASLTAIIQQMAPEVAIVELVGAMPGQGVSSTFKFGCGFGIVQGVITARGVPMHLVAASRWKRALGLDADKEKARALALRLWPARAELFARKKDHGRAEAALLARYGAERIVGGRR